MLIFSPELETEPRNDIKLCFIRGKFGGVGRADGGATNYNLLSLITKQNQQSLNFSLH
jgi:hypothetical protein